MDRASLPALRLSEWEDTRLYLQLVCQIIGKTRLKLHPPVNHWWHATLYLAPRGLTTAGIPYQDSELEIVLDLFDHRILLLRGGAKAEVPLGGAIADVYAAYRSALKDMGVDVKIVASPYKCKSEIAFANDHDHATYDREAAHRAWTVLAQVDGAMRRFRSGFVGKCSPVHMFWHSFDLACTRFSGRPAPVIEGADPVTREAYTHEVCSAGFWFGDDNLPEAAFYCYNAPLPAGIEQRPLPAGAEWLNLWGSPMAILRYEDVRKSADPGAAVQTFLQSSYEAGAEAAGWDRAALETQRR